MAEIIVGVVAGVLTSALLSVGKAIWESKITPYLAELRYQGVRVDGPWVGVGDDPTTHIHSEARLFIEQNAQNITGSFTYSFRSPEKNFTLDFKVNGYIWEGYLTLNCLPKDRRVTSYATALLKIHGGGIALVGQYCFRNVETESVSAVPMSLSRGDAPVPGPSVQVPVTDPTTQPLPAMPPASEIPRTPAATSLPAG
jgi:hypothetical protein